MGVNRNEVVMVGINLNNYPQLQKINNEYLQDWNDPEVDKMIFDKKNCRLTTISDVMNGKYDILGLLVSYGDEYEGLPLLEFPIDYLKDLKEEASILINNWLDTTHKLRPEDMLLYVFTYWH